MSDARNRIINRPMRIKILPDVVKERIAAGEVIERPASVVRELLDNALDAGAGAIRVEIRDGGIRTIRVSDDGSGILAEDLALACAPHATSKVGSLADLDAIHSLGFRGEALASIAAVAEIKIASAPDESGLATVLSLRPEGGETHISAARVRGTTVTVRNLFSALPARRAVLRGPRSEAVRVLTVVRTYALAYPGVRFTFADDGRLILQTHGTELTSAITSIYGSDAGRALRPLEAAASEPAAITGMIASRAFSFPTRDHVVVVVNGRPVSNRSLFVAAEAGYRPLLRKGRHPLLVVLLTVPPDRVDANIHPAKAEVLLRDETTLAAALRTVVHSTLGAAPLTIGEEPLAGSHFQPMQMRLPIARPKHRIAERASRRHIRATIPPEADEPGHITTLTAIAQFDDSLILARSAAGALYLVDQHRAHERALYETLKQQTGSLLNEDHQPKNDGKTIRLHQMLLEPVLVELTSLQAMRLAQRADELAALGLECQPFGGTVFLVRAMPNIPDAAHSPTAFAAELAHTAAEDTNDWLNQICISLACRSATRRGQKLPLVRQQELLDGLRSVTAKAVCPHGSPLLLRLTASYLASKFEW